MVYRTLKLASTHKENRVTKEDLELKKENGRMDRKHNFLPSSNLDKADERRDILIDSYSINKPKG